MILWWACVGTAPEPVDTEQADTAPTCAWTGPAAEQPAASPAVLLASTPRNVLLVSIDTLRVDHLGQGDTPTLDGLLDAGVRAADHRACSNWTLHSMGCAMAGAYGLETGFVPALAPLGDGEISLPAYEGEQPLLAERLREAGFATALASGNSFLSGHYGLEKGFQVVESGRYDGDEVTTLALDAWDRLDDHHPFFLHVHYLDPHDPYAPPDSYLEGLEELERIDYQLDSFVGLKQLEDDWDALDEDARALVMEHVSLRYRAELRFLDDQIAALLAGLGERGALDETLVVLLSDHGEQFAEHGAWGHGEGLYGEETRSMFGLWVEGIVPAVVDTSSTHADLVPTVLHVLGLEGETGGAVLGTAGSRPVYATQAEPETTTQTIDLDGWRLVYTWTGELELYELATDPDELVDRVANEPERVQAMWELLGPAVERLACLEPAIVPTDPAL